MPSDNVEIQHLLRASSRPAADSTEITWNGTFSRRNMRMPAIVLSNVPRPAAGHAVRIVQLLRAVDADADADMPLLEQIAPFAA